MGRCHNLEAVWLSKCNARVAHSFLDSGRRSSFDEREHIYRREVLLAGMAAGNLGHRSYSHHRSRFHEHVNHSPHLAAGAHIINQHVPQKLKPPSSARRMGSAHCPATSTKHSITPPPDPSRHRPHRPPKDSNGPSAELPESANPSSFDDMLTRTALEARHHRGPATAVHAEQHIEAISLGLHVLCRKALSNPQRTAPSVCHRLLQSPVLTHPSQKALCGFSRRFDAPPFDAPPTAK